MKTLCSVLTGLMVASSITQLAAITVTNLNDSGPGSLRAALEMGGNIDFAVTGIITLTSGELVVNQATTITGPGAEQLTITRSGAEGTPAFRVLRVLASPVTLSGLTLSNGRLTGTHNNGAGILNEGTLTLSNCVVRGNRVTDQLARGAGLFNANHAALTLNRCVVAENVVAGEYSSGGGIYAFGTVGVNDSTFRGNRCEGLGGGLHVDYYGSASVARCTFSDNAAAGTNAQGSGGGIYSFGGLEIVNSTLSGNSAGDTGGGIQVDALASSAAIRNCTVSGNSAKSGAGLYGAGSAALSAPRGMVADSIIAGNSPDDLRCAGILVSSGYNLIGQVGGGFFVPAPGDQLGVTAEALKLTPLANNGGPTQTRALLAGCPAIDAGNPTNSQASDQRGTARPFGSRADIGAFELDVILPPVVTVLATQTNTTEMGPTIFVAPGEFTISRSGSTNEPLQVFYRLSGTASNGVDYHYLSNSVVIPAGQSSAQLLILGFFDQLVEGTERVELHLETLACPAIYPPPPGCYLVGTPAEAVVNIHDYNQPTNRPPTVQIFTPANNQWFTAGEDIFIAAQAQDLDGYDTIQTVEFFAGEHSLGITTNFPTLDPIGPFRLSWQDVPSGQYNLKALATDDHGAATWSEPVRITVFDAMLSRVTLRASDTNASEAGDPGAFTLAREGATNYALNVFYAISGTASNGVDYATLSGNAVLEAGERETTIQVTPINDSIHEGVERVELRLQPAPIFLMPYVIASPSNGVVNIGDNDEPTPKPVVTITANDAQASEAPGNPGQFRVHRTGPTNQSLQIYWAISGTASNGVDYARLTNLVVIPAGKTVVELPVTPIEDNLFEGTETVVATLHYPPFGAPLPYPYTLGAPSNAVVNISDNDEPQPKPVVTITASDAQASETPGNPGQFRIHRSGSTNQTLQLYLAISGTASNGVDYARLTNLIILPAGRSAAELVVTPINDNLFEGAETVVAALYYPPVAGPGAFPYVIGNPSNAIVTITDNDEPPPLPLVTIQATDPTASETPGNPGQFRVQRTGPTNQSLHVHWAINGSASNGVDYARLTNLVVIPAGKTAVEFLVTPVDDNLVEGAETVVATLHHPLIAIPPTYTIGFPSNAVVNITDNDAGEFPVVTIEAPHPMASETPGNPGLFHINRTGPTNNSLTVFWRLGGTASNGVDYLSVTNPVVIPAGHSFVRVAVVPLDDQLVESNETVSASLFIPLIEVAFPYTIGAPSNAVVTILDNDLIGPPPFVPAVVTIEATDPQARETGLLTVVEPGKFTIRRTGNTNVTLHVQCVIEGTASNGVDYISLSNIVIIPSGVTSVPVAVYPLNDNFAEGTETVRLRVQSPICIAIYPPPPECYQVGVPDSATVFISDPEAPLPVVSILARDAVAAEGTNCVRWIGWSNTPSGTNFCGTNMATFLVRREGSTNESLAVAYEVSGTASNGVDYLSLPGVVTIPAGRRAAEVSIVPVDDVLREHTETIRLTLRPASSAPDSHDVLRSYTIGRSARAGALLVDNDQPRPVTGPLSDRSFHLTHPGANGAWFRIETSTNLIHWTALCTNVVTDGAIHFVDPDMENLPNRFYRAVLEANPAME